MAQAQAMKEHRLVRGRRSRYTPVSAVRAIGDLVTRGHPPFDRIGRHGAREDCHVHSMRVANVFGSSG